MYPMSPVFTGGLYGNSARSNQYRFNIMGAYHEKENKDEKHQIVAHLIKSCAIDPTNLADQAFIQQIVAYHTQSIAQEKFNVEHIKMIDMKEALRII